ncbi:toxin VasX, partial [Candidatus Schmidhempelia bombi]
MTLTDEQKQQELEDVLIYEQAEKSSALAQGGCGVCKRKGFPIFLVRKAVIPEKFKGIDWSKDTCSLGEREPSVGLKSHKYVYRTLRKGYVYILAQNKAGVWEYIGYEVTPSGALRHKTIHDMKERNIKEIPSECHKGAHHINGAAITIDTSIYQGDAYIAYTRRAWSKATRDYYINLAQQTSHQGQTSAHSDVGHELKRFSKIRLTQRHDQKPEELSPEGRSFSFSDFDKNKELLELACTAKEIGHVRAQDDVKTYNFSQYLFTSQHPFNSLKLEESDKNYKQCQTVLQEMKNYATLVLEDSFGVAEELSYQRQLTIEPITQLIAGSEARYAELMNDAYNRELLGTENVNDALVEVIERYRQQHPDEAEIIYDRKQPITEQQKKNGFWGEYQEQVVVDNHFLDKKHYELYGNILRAEIPSDYFNEKRLHIRKTLSYIEQYKNELKYSYEVNSQDQIVYTYTVISESIRDHKCLPKDADKNSCLEVSLTREEEKKALAIVEAQERKNTYETFSITNLKAYRAPNTARQQAEAEFNKKWQPYESQLQHRRIKNFQAQEAEEYEKLCCAIEEHSMDYFHYLTWLFGHKAQRSHYTPPEITDYNRIAFWRIECDTNGSNNHVGYLTDFIKIVDFSCLGNIRLPYQYGIWDILLSDEQSAYFHIIGNHADSFWQQLLKLRLAQLDTEQEEESTIDQLQGLSARPDQTEQLLKQLEASESLDSLFFWEKGRLMLQLSQQLISKMLEGIGQKSLNDSLIAPGLIQHHLSQSTFVIDGKLICPVRLTQIPVGELPTIIEYFTPAMQMTQNQKESPGPNPDKLIKIDWTLINASSRIVDLYGKLKKIATPESIKSFNEFKQMIKLLLSQCSHASLIENTLMVAFCDIKWKEVKREIIKGARNSYANGLLQFDSTKIKLDSTQSSKLAYIKGIEVFVQGVQLGCTFISYHDNRQKLETFGLGQTVKDELNRELAIGMGYLVSNAIVLFNMLLELTNNALPDVLRKMIQTRQSLSKNVNNVLVTSSWLGSVMGVMASIVTMIEGINILRKGLHKKKGGSELAYIYIIGGGLQIVAGSLALIQGLGLLAFLGPIGIGLYFLSLIAGIVSGFILWKFEDKSDSWDALQIWLNRCLVGNWTHHDKGLPYPPSFS